MRCVFAVYDVQRDVLKCSWR